MAFTAVDKGETYFNTVLYTGNDTARDITTGLVSTDFIWNKRRDSTGSHLLYDRNRGINIDMNTHNQEADETQVGTVTAFGTNTFSLGTHGGTNASGESKVSWCWAAGGAASPTASPVPISIGTDVQLRGLQAKPELNGQRGVVTGFIASAGRCSVQLEDGRGPFNIKLKNLEVVVSEKKNAKKEKEKGKK